MSKGFLLKQLLVKSMEKNTIYCDIHFLEDDYKVTYEPTTTAIIGTNGAGKSFLLMVISDLFYFFDKYTTANMLTQNAFLKLKNKMKLKYDYYEITYSLNDDIIKIVINNNVLEFYFNNISSKISKEYLPTKVLGVSYMLNDKFTFKQIDSSVYQYLGVRKISNASWTSSVTDKVVECFLKIYTEKSFKNEITNFINLEPTISFLVTPSKKDFFSTNICYENLKEKISLLTERSAINFRRNYRDDKLKKLTDEDLYEIISFLEYIKTNKMIVKNDDGVEHIAFEISSGADEYLKNKIKWYYSQIRILRDLKFISSMSFFLRKNGEPFLFESASSGEKHFIFDMVNILSNIEEKSLILIDEPEISMHPNWQIQYLDNLKKIFTDYTSCHFVIATHSHFIVSDLQKETSSLIRLTYNAGEHKREAELIPYSTYAWSAENILYNVFQVRTTRNWYFESELYKLISLMQNYENNENELQQVENLTQKLKEYIYDSSDPLNVIILQAEEFLTCIRKN